MVDYAAAIKKPFQDTKTLVIGIILGFIPVVSLLVLGYALGVGRKSSQGDESLPAFSVNSIVDYIKDLVFAFIIGIVYALPGLVLLGIGLVAALGSVLPAIATGNMQAVFAAVGTGLVAGGVFIALGILLLIIGGLLASMGIFYYLTQGSLGAAFNISGALKKVLTGAYWVTLIVFIVLAIVYTVVLGVLSLIPIIGSLVGLGLMTYGLYTTYYTMLGEVFKETK